MAETATSAYFCAICNEDRDDEICPICGQGTRTRDDQEQKSDNSPAPLAKTASIEPSSPDPDAPANDPTDLLPVVEFPKNKDEQESKTSPQPLEPLSRATKNIPVDSGTGEFRASRQEIAEYLEEGFEIFLIAGIAGSGKTELLESFKQGRTLGQVVRKDGLAMPTSPGDFFCHPLPLGKRKILFVDASGEHFEKLYADPSTGARIGSGEAQFLRLITDRLKGLVLLINLQQHWSGDERQATVLRNILILLRFLKGGGIYQAGARSFQEQVDAQIGKLPRLRIPVQFLMSRADQLTGTQLPTRADDSWLQTGSESRRLYPTGEEPLLVAHHYLPTLLDMLQEHARLFRADFVHSLVTDQDTEVVMNHEGCGVHLIRQWLVETSARPWWTMLPTRYSLGGQRRLDRILRRSRWLRLPPVKPLGTAKPQPPPAPAGDSQ